MQRAMYLTCLHCSDSVMNSLLHLAESQSCGVPGSALLCCCSCHNCLCLACAEVEMANENRVADRVLQGLEKSFREADNWQGPEEFKEDIAHLKKVAEEELRKVAEKRFAHIGGRWVKRETLEYLEGVETVKKGIKEGRWLWKWAEFPQKDFPDIPPICAIRVYWHKEVEVTVTTVGHDKQEETVTCASRAGPGIE
jgi:hypothetical protein